tara:strand:- start:838 stop:1041 length:204 start_codon:yes stop_codon:yes gene_type:complete
LKKFSLLSLSILFIGIISCRDTKKEQQELDATLDKIEAVEQDLRETSEEVENKAKEAESALIELDSI